MTWNVWGRFGAWEPRQAGLEAALLDYRPDVVCLTESWSTEGGTQAEQVASRLGLRHSLFAGDWLHDDWTSGIGVTAHDGTQISDHYGVVADLRY